MATRPGAGQVLRSLAYMAWLYGLMLVMGIICLPLMLGPRKHVMAAMKFWGGLQVWGLEKILGLRIEVRGLRYLPAGAALVAAKHQGMLDTVAPFDFLPDPCFVLKRELMRLPVFGWYAHASGMIPIDRSAGSSAIRALNAAARLRMQETRQIVIFPEGTRTAPGAPPDYKSGVTSLYRDMELPCTPVATNSGLFWPAHGFVRSPGVAVYEFLEPIPPGLKRAEFMRLLEERIETASNALLAEARQDG